MVAISPLRINTHADIITSEAARLSQLGINKNAKPEVRDSQKSRLDSFSTAARLLPSIKRFSYDSKLLELVKLTEKIDNEEIIGALNHVTFPFDQFWIEGAIPADPNFNFGALVYANQTMKEFSFLFYLTPINGKTSTQNHLIKVSATDGVIFDEDELLKLTIYRGVITQRDESSYIDLCYEMSLHLARVITILGSPNISSNFNAGKTERDLELKKTDITRRRLKRPPILDVDPIIIDVSRINLSNLKSSDPKTIMSSDSKSKVEDSS